jgi:hypothetical protein
MLHYMKTHVYMKFKWIRFLGIYKNVIFKFVIFTYDMHTCIKV